jgi:hypothetical protein
MRFVAAWVVGVFLLAQVQVVNLAGQSRASGAKAAALPAGFGDPTSAEALLRYARLYVQALEVKPGERVVIMSDRSIPAIKNQAFVMAAEDAGAKATLIVVPGYPEARTPEQMFEHWLHMWWPEWVFTAFRQADAVATLSNVTHNHSYYEGHAVGVWFSQNNIRELMVDEGSPLMAYAPMRDFPPELEDAINAKVHEQLPEGTFTARVTDPEGTDLTLTFHNAGEGGSRRLRPPHVAHGFGAWRKGRVRTNGGPILVDAVNGTIVSSSLHVGPIGSPMKMQVKDSRIVAIEGGGKFGEWARSMVEKLKDTDFGYYGDKGGNFFEEFQLTTHPKAVPRKGSYSFSELDAAWRPTWRSGKIHVALGSGGPIFDADKKVVTDEFHIDFEMYSPTLTIGDKKIVDRGRLTALDDSAVRAVAKRFGNPDELLKEAWTPKYRADGSIDWTGY